MTDTVYVPSRDRIVIAVCSTVDRHPPIWNAARLLCENGYRVKLFSITPPSYKPPFTHQKLQVFYPRSRAFIHRVLYWLQYLSQFASRNLTSVHVHDYPVLNHFSTKFAHSLGVPIVYQAHELHDKSAHARRIHWAAKVICPEPNRARQIQSWYRLSEQPLIVPNSRFSTDIRRTPLLREHFQSQGGDLDNIEYLAIYQGLIAPRRQIEELLEAMIDVDRAVGLVLMGEGAGDYWSKCMAFINHANLSSRVIRIAAVGLDRVLDYTHSADLGILLYSDHSLNNRYCAPNKLYEYMMAGLPMIGSDLEGLRPYLKNLGMGNLVDSSDPRSIAKGINNLIADPSRFQEISKRCRLLFQSQFRYEIVGKELLKAFDSL